MNKDEQNGFTMGVVYAVAQLIRYDSGSVDYLWNESGLTEEDLSVCAGYDADEVRRFLAKRQGT